MSETACEAVRAGETVDEAVLEDGAVSELGSAVEFVFDAGAVRQPASWAFELLEVAVLMVLEGLGVGQSLLV